MLGREGAEQGVEVGLQSLSVFRAVACADLSCDATLRNV